MARRNGMVRRFGPGVIITHWVFAIGYLALVATGLGFEYRWANFLMGPTARVIHRYSGLLLIATPLIYLIINPRVTLRNLRDVFSWNRDDSRWILKAPGHYMLGKGDMPPVGMYNAGQKLNYIIVVLTGLGFAISGMMMWFLRPTLGLTERDLFRWAAITHQASFFIGVSMFCLHFYLALIHPYTKPALTAMITGYVPRSYAAGHHPKWLEKLDGRSGSSATGDD